jgi:hypothetical protein
MQEQTIRRLIVTSKMLTFALDDELWRLTHDAVTMTFVKKMRSLKAMIAADGKPEPAEGLTVEERDVYYGWRTVETHSFAIADLADVRVKWTDGCTDIDIGEFGTPCTLVEISVKPTLGYWENIFTDAVSDDPDHPLRPFWDEEVVRQCVEEVVGTIQRLIAAVADKK